MAGGQITSQKYVSFRGPIFTAGKLSKCDGINRNVLNFTNNLPGQLICFEGTDLGTTATTTVSYGMVSPAISFPCPVIFANATFVQCNSTEGIGRELTLSITVGQLDPARSTDVLSYPIPVIQPSTIRNLPTSDFNDTYIPDAIKPNYLVTFDVQYLPYSQSLWSQVSVSFGRKLPPDATWRACSNPQIYSVPNPSFPYSSPGNDPTIVALSCTAPSGFSTGYHFRVLGFNVYSDYSDDTFAYPDYGLVLHNVSGCDNNGISTENCPTVGGTTLTLRGVNFCDFVNSACALTIEIGGNLCTEIMYWDSSMVTCKLPAGIGGEVGITIIQDATFGNMEPPPTISYAIPTITKVTGCTSNFASSTSGCPTTGGTTLTISGKNFGANNAIVFIGTRKCGTATHDVSQTFITCPLPQGFGSNNLITVYDSTGRKSTNSSVSVSYQPCAAGSVINRTAFTCDTCDEGSYTDTAGSYSCLQCSPGRYANTAGLTGCTVCATGKHALDYGMSSCDNCTTGQYQQSLGQSTCNSCKPGYFSNITGLSSCYSCPSGRTTSDSGSISCGLCLSGNYAFQGKQCLPCPSGTYSGSDGLTACTSCAAGTYSTGGTNQCSSCASGSVAVKTGLVQCEPCAIGYYANSSNPVSCFPCAAGSVTNSAGQGSCTGCNPGFYVALPGQATCLACPQGRYQNYSGQTSCQTCAPGRYNSNVTGSSQCSRCAVGYYADAYETAECSGCQSGYYSNVSGSQSCTACPTGRYQDNSFQSDCIDCQTGKANSLTGQPQCAPCASGQISNRTGLSACIQCIAGFSQSSASACTICAAGLYQPSDGQQSCLQCSAGRYSGSAGSTTCITCAAGNFSSSRGSTSCTRCPTGQYSPNSGSSDCLPCLPGYNSSAPSSTGCSACAPGYYQETPGSTGCLECKAGYYNQFYGAATCPYCVAGYFTNATAQTNCIGCVPGTVNSAPASQSCDACAIGKYSSIVGQQSCLDCQGGRFTNLTGTSTCTICDSGTYSPARATSCTPCTQGTASGSKGLPDRCPTCSPGTFSTQQGATSCRSCGLGEYSLNTPTLCLPCPIGSAAAINGTSVCPQCAVGYHQPLPGQSQCLPCYAGTITATTGLQSCSACDKGKYVATDGQSVCLGCPPGKWNNITNATGCEPCDAGYYSGQGKLNCTACPMGTTSDAKRQKCDECPAGFYNNETASLTCYACPPGTFQSQPGLNTCEPCQAGRSSVAQAIICDICPQGLVAVSPGTVTPCDNCAIGQPNDAHTACECGVGTFANWDESGKTNCFNCDVGAKCDVSGITWETLQTAPGYWRSDTNSTLFYRCLLEDQCSGGRNSTCDTYRTGPLCALCQSGATEDSTGKCIACQAQKGASIAQVFFIILAIIIALVGMYALLLWSDRALVQMVVAYDTVEIDKQRQLEDLRKQYGHKSVVTDAPPDTAMSTDEKGDPEPMKTTTEHSDIEYRPIGKPNITYKLKIILSFFQIATNLTFALNIPWPRLFARFVSAFNFINLDFIQWSTVGCVASIDYYIEMVLITLLPIATILCMVTFYLAPFFIMNRGQDLEHHAARSRHLKKVWKLVLFSMFLVYPKVSSTVLNLFVCREIAGVYYLVADLSLECYTGRWSKYLPYDIFMILVYPIGIPAFFLFLLIQNKARFHLPGIRLQLGFLYDGFDSNTWWFELADMLHKLLLTSVLAFFPIGAQMPIGMSIATVHLCVIILGRPYYRKGDDRLHMFAQVELFLLMLAGFVCYKGNGLDDRSDVIMSLFLIFVLMGFLSVFLVQAGNIVKKQWQKYDEKRKQKDLPDMYLDVSASGLAPPSQSEMEDSSRRGSSSSVHTRRRGPSESISIAGQVSGVKFLKAWTKARRQENKAQIRRKGAKTLADIQEATDDAQMERNPMWRERAGSQEMHDSPSHMSSSITTVSDSSGLQEVTLAPDVIAALQAVSPIPFHYESAELSPSEESRPLMNEDAPPTPDRPDIKTDFPPTLESAILEAPPQNVRKSAQSTPKLIAMTPKEQPKIASATPTRSSVTQRFFPAQARKSGRSSPILTPLIPDSSSIVPQLAAHMELPADTGSDGSLDNSLASGGSQDSSPPTAISTLEPRKSAKS